MKKMKYWALALLGVLASGVRAEGEATIDQTYIDTWVTTAKTAIESWITKLSPLFIAALGIVLALAAWSLFKKVTNKAK